MENELKEKDYYKQMICYIVGSIDDVKLLAYLHRLINNIAKAGN